MQYTQKFRSTEQILKKMLNEEKMLVDLELAIKKEQFKKHQKSNQDLHNANTDDNGSGLKSVLISETNQKTNNIFGFLQNKLGFTHDIR